MTQKNIQRGILLMFFCGSMQVINADYGRSPLIEYIIKQEAKIEKIRQEVEILSVGKEIVALRKRSQDLEECIDTTLHDIEIMSDTGAIFTIEDDFGRTALNYCQTKEIYCKLRDSGMPFQYDAWLYVYRYECMRASLVAVAGALILYHQGFFE